MRDLTLVGLSEDGTSLLLVGDAGEEFSLPVDDALRNALRRDHARLGQWETQMESALRPRDIQARIRAGESPESVAEAAQTPLERVMTYATPVLAERAHVADRAQRASVRRKGGEGHARILGDLVTEQLRARDVDPATVEWDAWRREDGRWTVLAVYRAGKATKRAEFTYDAPGRYALADNDEARELLGEEVRRPDARARSGRRLSAVSDDDQELPLGADAIDLVRGDLSSADAPLPADESAPAAPASEEATVELTEAVAALRDDRSGAEVEDQAEPEPAPEPEPEPRQPAKRAAKKTRGRASVPSWDEIMFGGGKSE